MELQPVMGQSVTWLIVMGVVSTEVTVLGPVEETIDRLTALLPATEVSREDKPLSPPVEWAKVSVVLAKVDRTLARSLEMLLERFDMSSMADVSLLTMESVRAAILLTDEARPPSRGPSASPHALEVRATDRPVVATRDPRL